MTDDKYLAAMRHEIDAWRNDFLDEKFEGAFKFISHDDKHRLKAYFLSLPSESFRGPYKEWDNCVSALLQTKDGK